MKLLVATGLYPPDIGGPATYAVMVEQELPKYGVEVIVLPFASVRKYPKGISHLMYFFKIFAAGRRADVICTLDAISVGVPAAVATMLLRKPLILRLGGDQAWEQGRERFGVTDTLDEFVVTEQPHWRVRLMQRLQTFTARSAKVIITPSEYLRGVIMKWGIDKAKISVIYSALNPLPVEETKEELRAELSIAGPMILSAGRLVPWKGFGTLIRIMPLLLQKFPELQLCIAGEGTQRAMLEELIEELGVADNVRLLGSLDKSTLGMYKKAADVFVLNTGYEGLSHELLEVMALGTPVVTTDVGGNPEIITSEREGILVSYNDAAALQVAITRLLQNEQLAERLTQAARARVKDFSNDQSVTRLLELLQSHHGAKT